MTAALGAMGDLGRAVDEDGEVTAVERVVGQVVELTVRLPHLAAAARAGEFAQIRVASGPVPLLRRPMSVAWTDGDAVSFVFEPVGEGTGRLARLRPGDGLRVLGPLGVGFGLPATARRILCVSGGLGCAPFPLAVRSAVSAGAESVVVLNGAATADRLYPADRLSRGDPRVTVIEATDDGTRGRRSRVTDLVGDAVAEGAVDAIWACGPNPMLQALAAVIEQLPARPGVCQVSLEAPMGCGIGTCLGCALPVRGVASSWALCCRQGPVMDVDAVDWGALGALPGPDAA